MSINDTTYGFPVVRAMQAEIDRLRAELAVKDNVSKLLADDNYRLRAELAEAREDHATAYGNSVLLAQENARLRAELASCRATVAKADDDLYAAERAIARVRELCDLSEYARQWRTGNELTDFKRDVLRALDGGTE